MMSPSNHAWLWSLLLVLLSFPSQSLTTLCETCSSAEGADNVCHETTRCLGVSSASGATANYCACTPGFRAHGVSADDVTQQFRLSSAEGIVFVRPGIACNQLCDGWTLGSDGCQEVLVYTQCAAVVVDIDNSNEKISSVSTINHGYEAEKSCLP